MCAPKMPSPPDPWETATAQGALNNTSAFAQNRLNQVNQTTPYGSLTYQPTGEDITGKGDLTRLLCGGAYQPA